MTPHTTPELPESIEKALKPLYVSGSMDVFNLRVAIEKELSTLETKHRAEVEEAAKELIAWNEDKGWKAAYKSGSDAGAGYTIGYKAALEELLERTK